MKAKQIKSMSKPEMEAKVLELRKEQIKLYTQVSSGTNIKNPGLVRKTRRSIAQLLHQMNKKEE